MAGGDEIDVVTPLFLQMHHDAGQVPGGDLLALAAVADLPVLAKDAEQVAVREENGARPPAAHQGVLLAPVGAV